MEEVKNEAVVESPVKFVTIKHRGSRKCMGEECSRIISANKVYCLKCAQDKGVAFD